MIDKQLIAVVGRFPPPLDGQAIATKRLSNLLADRFVVHRIRTTAPTAASDKRTRAAQQVKRAWSYFKSRTRITDRFRQLPEGIPTILTSVSPSPAGHFRDLLTTLPGIPATSPLYSVIHRGDFDGLFTHPVTKHTAKHIVDRHTGFVFLSQSLSEACAKWIPSNKRYVIPNTIDDEIISPASEVHARVPLEDNQPFRLLFLSNMIPSKGYWDVLEATRTLNHKGQNIRTTFIGRWQSKEDQCRFETFVLRYRLTSQVNHLGAVTDRSEIRKHLVTSHAFVLPTTYPIEAQPLTIIEALANGTPVITTRHASIPEMITESQEGFFVPSNNPLAIANAVLKLRDPLTWNKCSLNARTRFEKSFSNYAVQTEWNNLLTPPPKVKN